MGRKDKKDKGKGSAAGFSDGSREAKVKDRMVKQALEKESKRRRGMRDKAWEADFDKLTAQLALLGLYIKDVPSDGNCLFSAFGDQLQGDPRNHFEIRTQIMNYMEENEEDFQFFVEDDEPWAKYLPRMRRRAEWGGNLEIQAASMLYGVNICIHSLNAPRLEVNNWGSGARTIHISYHDGQHYASVRPLGESSADTAPGPITIATTTPRKPSQQGSSSSGGPSAGGSSGGGAVASSSNMSSEPNEDEAVIMRATGAIDLVLVRQVLDDYGGDVGAAIDYITTTNFEMGVYEDADVFQKAAAVAVVPINKEEIVAAIEASLEEASSNAQGNKGPSSSPASSTTTAATGLDSPHPSRGSDGTPGGPLSQSSSSSSSTRPVSPSRSVAASAPAPAAASSSSTSGYETVRGASGCGGRGGRGGARDVIEIDCVRRVPEQARVGWALVFVGLTVTFSLAGSILILAAVGGVRLWWQRRGDSKNAKKPVKALSNRERKNQARLEKAAQATNNAKNPPPPKKAGPDVPTAEITQGDFGSIAI